MAVTDYVEKYKAGELSERQVLELLEEYQDVLRKKYQDCLLELKCNAYFLRNVPKRLKDYEMCLAAVSSDYGAGALEFVPEHLRDRKICLIAVKQDYETVLQFVPESVRDRDLCLEAVRYRADAMLYVPEHLKDPGFCLDAVENNEDVLDYIPDHYKDSDGKLLPRDEMEHVLIEMHEDNSPVPVS